MFVSGLISADAGPSGATERPTDPGGGEAQSRVVVTDELSGGADRHAPPGAHCWSGAMTRTRSGAAGWSTEGALRCHPS